MPQIYIKTVPLNQSVTSPFATGYIVKPVSSVNTMSTLRHPPPSHASTSLDIGNRNLNVKLHFGEALSLSEARVFQEGLEMGSSDDGYDDPFAGIYEPFLG
uniref:Uncharacterized protein n=1 Tax=Lactuca sativa TaxID=4236 RepID=A0A9R1XLR5_LACSA|nr:hypothetical protein LSAT_V11C300142100 [Lactuca sativa]